ncbi:MAG: ATP-dependent helicase HrpB [Acidimicrobiales bacterium]
MPVDAIIPELLRVLDRRGVAVVQAPPGSGKTTRIPLALLGAPWLSGRRILVLEPRRVAARAAARRMAWALGEDLGERIGYRIRQERVGGPSTRIEVITEGVLTRMLQADPSLREAGVVVFDEFHERSITTDLGLALTLDARTALRPDLRLLVMSATLDASGVAALLDDAPIVTARAVSFPVTTVWLGKPSGRIEAAVARTVARALEAHEGDVLAFLPGAAEIRHTERFLRDDRATVLAAARADVVTLHGTMAGPAQDRALRAASPGRRKVILATSIAETSLTIDGVRIVVDSGLMRANRFDPAGGMSRLVTLPVSQAVAEQRQGRAARQAPGICFRLWGEGEHSGLPRAAPPEILVADLAPLALDLAEWGVSDPAQLQWMDAPPAGAMRAAREVLTDLSAIDEHHRITAHGRKLARLGVHPRLGHLMTRSAEMEGSAPGTAQLACEIAAILSDGDPHRDVHGGADADLAARVEEVRNGRAPRLAETARRWSRLLGAVSGTADSRLRRARGVANAIVPPEEVGRLVALAYPERVGRQRRGRTGHWLLRNGRGAWVPETDALAGAAWIVAAGLDGDRRAARIWLGAPLHSDDVDELFGAEMTIIDDVRWDPRTSDVVDARERRLGAITVSSTRRRGPPGSSAGAALLDGIRDLGIKVLPWTPDLERLRARVAFAGSLGTSEWADLRDGALLDSLDTWLSPWLTGLARRGDLARIPLGEALWHRIGAHRRGELEVLAPTHVTVATGERRRIEYRSDGPPSLTVRLQELFGTTVTPTVGGDRVTVQLHLTSPAGRPVQVTSDLESFWRVTYPQIRGELRARYPRHAWPENPLTALPTNRPTTRRR